MEGNVDTGTVVEQPIVAEEVVETPDVIEDGEITPPEEETVEETTDVEETPEEEPEQEEKEEKEEKKDFDADELDFDEEEEEEKEEDKNYEFEGYNLEAYKDIFDFDSPDAVALIKEEAAKLKQKGYSQDKVEGYIDALLEREANKKEVVTAEQVKQELNESLTREEKANYKAIKTWLKDGIKGTEFEGQKYNDIMSNPQLVKLMNTLYKTSIAKSGVRTVEQPKPTPRVRMDYRTAMGAINDKIDAGLEGQEFDNYIKDLSTKMTGEELAQFKDSVYSIFKLEI